jgi:hypothetical protein
MNSVDANDDIITLLERMKQKTEKNSPTESSDPVTVQETAANCEEIEVKTEDFDAMRGVLVETPSEISEPKPRIFRNDHGMSKPRVVSNTNLVGAPRPSEPSGGYKYQKAKKKTRKNLAGPRIAMFSGVLVFTLAIFAVVIPLLLQSTPKETTAVVADPPKVVQPEPQATIVPQEVQVLDLTTEVMKSPVITIQAFPVETISTDVLSVGQVEDFKWLIEVSATTEKPVYEKLVKKLKADGFKPILKLEQAEEKTDIFRVELHEKTMNSALVKMSQLKKISYLEPKRLVLKPHTP